MFPNFNIPGLPVENQTKSPVVQGSSEQSGETASYEIPAFGEQLTEEQLRLNPNKENNSYAVTPSGEGDPQEITSLKPSDSKGKEGNLIDNEVNGTDGAMFKGMSKLPTVSK